MSKQRMDYSERSASEASMCNNGCGFFGSSATLNMCSKCYKDYLLTQSRASDAKIAVDKTTVTVPSHEEEEEDDDVVVPAPPSAVISSSATTQTETDAPSSDTASSSSAATCEDRQEEKEVPKKGSSRCHSCRKKVGLTGFKCRCGDVFCGLHRYSESHDCSFNYKTAGREQLKKANPVVKAGKIQKI